MPRIAYALQIQNFEQRFRYIEQQAEKENRTLSNLSLEEMNRHWETSKKAL